MKPSRLTYHAAGSADEAVALLAEHGDEAKVLAGGQSLVPLLNLRLAAPAHLVDLLRAPELGAIERVAVNGGGSGAGEDSAGGARAAAHVVVGAGVRQAAAEDDAALMRDVPLLQAALPYVAHREIRNAGTVCGSLAHGDAAAEIPLVARALDAQLVVRGPHGERVVDAADFFVAYLETALEPDELLAAVRFPVAGPGTGAAFGELARRAGDYAIAGVGAQVVVRDGVVADARIGCLGVAPVPFRVTAAERALVGRAPDSDAIAEAAAAGARELDPGDDVHASAALRRRAAETLMRRTIAEAAERATAQAGGAGAPGASTSEAAGPAAGEEPR